MDTLLRKKKICIFLLRFNFFPTGLSSFKLLESASNCSGYQKYKRDHKTYPSKSAVEKVYRDCSSRNSKSSKDSNDESPSSSTLSFSSRRPPRILTNRKFGSRRRHTPSKIDSILM